jgi:hypothetical protein
MGGRGLLRGRKRKREMRCRNRFPWSTLLLLFRRRNGISLGRLRRQGRFVSFR